MTEQHVYYDGNHPIRQLPQWLDFTNITYEVEDTVIGEIAQAIRNKFLDPNRQTVVEVCHPVIHKLSPQTIKAYEEEQGFAFRIANGLDNDNLRIKKIIFVDDISGIPEEQPQEVHRSTFTMKGFEITSEATDRLPLRSYKTGRDSQDRERNEVLFESTFTNAAYRLADEFVNNHPQRVRDGKFHINGKRIKLYTTYLAGRNVIRRPSCEMYDLAYQLALTQQYTNVVLLIPDRMANQQRNVQELQKFLSPDKQGQLRNVVTVMLPGKSK